MESSEGSEAYDSDISSTYHSDSEWQCCATHVSDDTDTSTKEDSAVPDGRDIGMQPECDLSGLNVEKTSVSSSTTESDISSTYHSDSELRCCMTYRGDSSEQDDVPEFVFRSVFTIFQINDDGDDDIIEDQEDLLDILSDMKSLNQTIDSPAEVIRVDYSTITWFVPSYESFTDFMNNVERTKLKRRLNDFAVCRGLKEKIRLAPSTDIDIDVSFENERRLKLKAKQHFLGTYGVRNIVFTKQEPRCSQNLNQSHQYVPGERSMTSLLQADFTLHQTEPSDIVDSLPDVYKLDIPQSARIEMSTQIPLVDTPVLEYFVRALTELSKRCLQSPGPNPEEPVMPKLDDPDLWPGYVVRRAYATLQECGETEEVKLLSMEIRLKHLCQTVRYFNTEIKRLQKARRQNQNEFRSLKSATWRR